MRIMLWNILLKTCMRREQITVRGVDQLEIMTRKGILRNEHKK